MTDQRKQLSLMAFIASGGRQMAWRHPDIQTDSNRSLAYFIDYAQTAERGLFDAIFRADGLSVGQAGGAFEDNPALLEHLSSVSIFEPLSLMSVLSAHTERVGLVYTASTTYSEPFTLARQVASLDHLSGGRAGWNLVTTMDSGAAKNFGRASHVEHDARYRIAEEFYDVVTGLWDSFEDDAFLDDKVSGRYFDLQKLHAIAHAGEHFRVAGPLSMARPIQGHPVVAQAGASGPGRALGARTADVIFSMNHTLEDALAFYEDVKAQAMSFGRARDDIKILGGAAVILGESQQHAEDRFAEIGSYFPLEIAIENLALGVKDFDPDDPYPDNAARTSVGIQKIVTDYARRNNLTIRQTAQRLAATNKHRLVLGTPESVADQLEEWFAAGAVDGFVVISPYLLNGFKQFVEQVVPILQRRGLFRTRYEGTTLRQNLGLKRPGNRFTPTA